jgi:activator of HSP90 ATPase
MKSFNKTYSIHASAHDVWQALTDPKTIARWDGGPATMEAKTGTKFSLWGGDIHGTNTKVISEKKLVQDWFSGDWNAPSVVTFELSGNTNNTKVKLTHTNIPDAEFSSIKSGWDDYYMIPLKNLVESFTNK